MHKFDLSELKLYISNGYFVGVICMKIKYLPYLKHVMFGVFFLTLPFSLIEQFIYQSVSSDEDKITFGIIGIILGLIETFLLYILLGHGIKSLEGRASSLGVYYKKHLRDLVVETFRGMGRIAVGLLLIVPGIKRLIQYYLIPYIVQFDLNYQEGKVDVLVEAEKLLQGHLSKFSFILFLTQVVMFVVQIASVNFNLFTTPLAWILFYVAEATLQASIFLLFYNYYLKLKNINP